MSFVYAIQRGDKGPIKIGISFDPQKRLEALQTALPERLHLLAQFPGHRSIEQMIHIDLSEYRLGGEWFRPAHEVKEYIYGLAKIKKATAIERTLVRILRAPCVLEAPLDTKRLIVIGDGQINMNGWPVKCDVIVDTRLNKEDVIFCGLKFGDIPIGKPRRRKYQ